MIDSFIGFIVGGMLTFLFLVLYLRLKPIRVIYCDADFRRLSDFFLELEQDGATVCKLLFKGEKGCITIYLANTRKILEKTYMDS